MRYRNASYNFAPDPSQALLSLLISAKGLFMCSPGCRKFYLTVFACTALIPWASAQVRTQKLRGEISDHASLRPIAGASVSASGPASASAVSDSLGQFELNIPPGKYHLLIQHSQYKGAVRENVEVYSGKQRVEDIELEALEQEIESVTVRASENARSFGLDLWNVQNFATVFYDPARVVNSHAGAINMDDGTNHLTVRGTSPNYVQWKLEEVEIVNPNHLENGGTQNDRLAPNGGGVSMISAQLMRQSAFHFAPFHGTHGNALAGLFDMRLRTGNTSRREHIIQASLLGIDISTEGPFSKNGAASYLLNFRYSTIGLLTQLGVNFGDEASNFSDLSHLLYLPHRSGFVRLFGINGAGRTVFEGKRDSAEVLIQKELQDIRYNSATYINGLSALTRLGTGAYLKSVFVYSMKRSGREAYPLYRGIWEMQEELDELSQSKFASVNYLSGQVGPLFTVKAGAYFNYYINETTSRLSGLTESGGRMSIPLLQPFLSAEGQVLPKLGLMAALHGYYLPAQGYSQLQPRLEVRYDYARSQQLLLAYGHSAQLQSHLLYLGHPRNVNLRPTSNQAVSVANVSAFRRISIRNEVYHQTYTDVPADSVSGFSGFNYFNERVPFSLQQNGRATVTGYDLRFEHHGEHLYFIGSSSLYSSRFSAGKTEREARFSTGYNFFVTAGREQRLKNKDHLWSVDLRGTYRNGFKEAASLNAPFDYSRQLPAYWRADLRLSYKKNKASSTVIWSLDLQNVAGARNLSYHYFDKVTQKEEAKYYLGLIPVLSYKVMF